MLYLTLCTSVLHWAYSYLINRIRAFLRKQSIIHTRTRFVQGTPWYRCIYARISALNRPSSPCCSNKFPTNSKYSMKLRRGKNMKMELFTSNTLLSCTRVQYTWINYIKQLKSTKIRKLRKKRNLLHWVQRELLAFRSPLDWYGRWGKQLPAKKDGGRAELKAKGFLLWKFIC